ISGRDPNSTSSPMSTPSRTTPRSSTPNGNLAERPAGNHARTRSFRTSTPVSARATAGQRRESLVPSTSGSSVEEEEAARAEKLAMLDDLKDRLGKAEISSEEYRKQAEVLQARFDEVTKEQVKYEEKCHELEEQSEALQNEKREATRKIREMEAIYEAERSAMVKEKEDMANREEELQMVIARLKDSLNQQKMAGEDEQPRPSRSVNPASPSLEGGSFAPPASLQRSDSRNQSKLILQKDKLIESLRLELAEAQIKLVESENQGGGRLQEVERLLMETRMANARLMEDNESYQLLLQEKTLNGDFGKDDFSYMRGAQSNEDALAALEGKTAGASLADELNDVAEGEEQEQSEHTRRLETELRSMKDQNKALTLYINRIIERLLQHQDFEHILDQTDSTAKPNTEKDLPPPPHELRQASGSSVLQRAKSMATGGPAAAAAPPGKPRPRPMSVMPAAANSAHFNPETAPSIPIGLGRSQSTRRSRPMSENFTGAASLVNQMYKGPEGPLSPTLRSSRDFFNTPQRERNTSGATAASVPGNFPGSMRSETSSVSGDSSSMANGDKDTISSTPNQSPPREKRVTQTFAAGNKPRPLRLVQENNEAQAAANKRQSWIGGWFAGVGAKKDEVVSP
ncbi:hypothetical protein M406DRAFT_217692, partial [Cryphonectria parasitica EP155]